MNNYTCFVVQASDTSQDNKPIYHLRLKWNYEIDPYDNASIFWKFGSTPKLRVGPLRERNKITISFHVEETKNQNLLLMYDNLRISDKISTINFEDIKFKFNITVVKQNEPPIVTVQNTKFTNLPIEYSLDIKS